MAESACLAEQCCRATAGFPPRAYALGTHIQKTAISVPSNIAEGHELQTGSFRLHVRVALGSLAELDTQIELAARLGWLSAQSHTSLAAHIRETEHMLRARRAALTRSLQNMAAPR